MKEYKLPLVYNWELAHKKIVAPVNPVTYVGLQTLISKNELIPGATYVIIDYRTIYDQPDYISPGVPKPAGDINTLTGPIEPLLVTAITPTQIGLEAISMVFPQDLIWYDINFTVTEVKGTPAKGRIIKRTDFEHMNTTGYDHRHVMFKRYEGVSSTGIFNTVWDTGFSSSYLPTFGDDCDNMDIAYIRGTEVGFDDPIFLVSNNIFGDNCEEFSCGQDFYNNTFGSGCYGVKFNHNTHDNIIGNNFYNNIIANEFANNIINDDFNTNNIGSAFAGNVIGQYFINNNIGNNFGYSRGNKIGDGFMNNTIGNDFYNNEIGNNFMENVIHHSFINTIITDGFQNVHSKVTVDSISFPGICYAGFLAGINVYIEIIAGFDGSNIMNPPKPQRYLGWFDISTSRMQYTGL